MSGDWRFQRSEQNLYRRYVSELLLTKFAMASPLRLPSRSAPPGGQYLSTVPAQYLIAGTGLIVASGFHHGYRRSQRRLHAHSGASSSITDVFADGELIVTINHQQASPPESLKDFLLQMR